MGEQVKAELLNAQSKVVNPFIPVLLSREAQCTTKLNSDSLVRPSRSRVPRLSNSFSTPELKACPTAQKPLTLPPPPHGITKDDLCAIGCSGIPHTENQLQADPIECRELLKEDAQDLNGVLRAEIAARRESLREREQLQQQKLEAEIAMQREALEQTRLRRELDAFAVARASQTHDCFQDGMPTSTSSVTSSPAVPANPAVSQPVNQEDALRLEELEQQRLLREALMCRERCEQEKIRREIKARASRPVEGVEPKESVLHERIAQNDRGQNLRASGMADSPTDLQFLVPDVRPRMQDVVPVDGSWACLVEPVTGYSHSVPHVEPMMLSRHGLPRALPQAPMTYAPLRGPPA